MIDMRPLVEVPNFHLFRCIEGSEEVTRVKLGKMTLPTLGEWVFCLSMDGTLSMMPLGRPVRMTGATMVANITTPCGGYTLHPFKD